MSEDRGSFAADLRALADSIEELKRVVWESVTPGLAWLTRQLAKVVR